MAMGWPKVFKVLAIALKISRNEQYVVGLRGLAHWAEEISGIIKKVVNKQYINVFLTNNILE